MDHGNSNSTPDLDAEASLRLIADPVLAPLFRHPSRIQAESAWHGHIPFAYWLVHAAAPRTIVELGTHAGVSYAAFCEAVLQGQSSARCFAVDTWKGDEHSGFYGEDVYASLKTFHDERYGTFSQLLRRTFDEAANYIPDSSVDLLHIDGRHRYEDVHHDFNRWLPKLSQRAVVLFHDTNVRDRDFGVWRFWEELAQQYPAFEFLHEHGLGVLALGSEVPAPVAALCRLSDSVLVGSVRKRFAWLGQRWSDQGSLRHQQELAITRGVELRNLTAAREVELRDLEAARAAELHRFEAATRQQIRAAHARAAAAEIQTRDSLARANEAMAQASAAQASLEAAVLRAVNAEKHAEALQHDKEIVLSSTSWRVTKPIRFAKRLLSGRLSSSPRAQPTPSLASTGAPATDPGDNGASARVKALASLDAAKSAMRVISEVRLRIVYVAGEPETPGVLYRCKRYSEGALRAGWEPLCVTVAELDAEAVRRAAVVVFWRCTWSEHISRMVSIAREFGAKVVFDIDDLMFCPEFASLDVIDGIRTIGITEDVVREMYVKIQQLMLASDWCTCATRELAFHLRKYQKCVHILPNGFDEASLRLSRLVVRERRQQAADGLVRLGYAAGTRTHQRDFKAAAGALVRVLRERPQTRLVLFRDPTYQTGLILIEEFPELQDFRDQIEWRDMVPLVDLPRELARFDINLAPLEIGNPFCEAKSELKYFEAALVEVPTVASPTGPFRRAISPSAGILAESEEEWYSALLTLVDDPGLRARLGRAAYYDVLWPFGPQKRVAAMGSLMHQLRGGRDASRSFMFDALQQLEPRRKPPEVPSTEVLFERDKLGEASVTVTIASYNYADFILEALESVRSQTLQVLDLIVVDDGSSDDSIDTAIGWIETYGERFNRTVVLRTRVNSGLGGNRNAGFDAAETPFVLPLDADNRLLPTACEKLLAALQQTDAAFAYPKIQQFGAAKGLLCDEPFAPMRLVGTNYIDAMALVGKWAWAAVGGYYVRKGAMGWEDYSLWCSLVELGQWGEFVPEVLAEYRVHERSMVNAITETDGNKQEMVKLVEERHPWLDVLSRVPTPRQSSGT